MDQGCSRETDKKVLIVEDELIIAKGIEKQLNALGYSVVDTVPTGEEAVEKALEALPDLVLMDINLKGDMDGVKAAEMIRLKADIPVVYLTAYADGDTLTRAKITEPFGYLVKPFQDVALKSTIEMALYKHKMESRIRRSKQFLSTILRSIDDAVVATDKKGVVTFVNPVAEELTGWRMEDAVGSALQEIFVIREEEVTSSLSRMMEEVLANGSQDTSIGRTLLFSRDGREIPIEASANPLAGGPGESSGMVLVFHDISKRVRTEEALRQSERLLRSVFKAVPDLVSIIDKDFRIVLSNWGGGYGYVSEDVRQRNPHCFDAYYGLADRCEPCHVVDLLKTGISVSREKYNPRIGFVEIHSAPVYNESGEINLVVEVVRDITERKRAEDKLAEEKERLAVTLRSIGDGVISTDVEGNILLMNGMAEEMTGWKQEEAIGKPFDEVFVIMNEKSGQPCENPVRRILDSGIQVELENNTVLVSRDGKKRVIADSGAPIRDRENGVIGAVLVFRDITEKRKMEGELLKARQLESIGILAGGIAHDFNNLLTAILGNISLAKMFTSEGDNIRQKLAEAEKASLRARDLTQQLLTFSRGGAPVKQTTGIADIIRESSSFTLSGSRTLCCFDLRENLWPVEVDVGQISQVINNLIINAEQAMPDGGLIDVACRNIHVGAEDLLPIRDGRYIVITIRDHGVGIPPDSLGRIFDPYYTTKKSGKGLGLATVYSIIKNHDGYIDVKSKIGEGSVFTIYLPCAPEGSVEPAAVERPPAVMENAAVSGRILVMDDEENIRDIAGEMLDFLGYEVEFARDGGEAVDLYKKRLQSAEPFSAVLLDLTVPGGMGGREAMDILRELDEDVKGIASSGYSNDPIMADYRTFGFRGIISKPYKLEEFKRVLEEVIGEGK